MGLKDRQQNVVDIPHCPVHGPRVGRALGLLVPRLPPAADFPLAFWVQSGAQLTLVVKAKPPLATAWFDAALGEALGGVGIEGLWLHGNPSAGAQLFTKRGWQHLWGRGWSTTAQGLRHGPAAFQQLVSQLYEAALDEAEAFLAPAARDGIVDLYCGVGASVVRWQRRGGRVLGVELDGNAVACARVNAPAAEILRGGCAQRLPQLRTWLEAGTFEERLGYLNPPRTGLEPAVTAWLASHRPLARLAYLSCSPNTLARDLGLLEAGGYRVVRLVPWDFFPHTRHVETLALLARVEPDPP
ncbi:MAG: class I SAM-dependent RNA methyltransferase [Candidatus Competibacterales bacterium]